MEYPYSLSDYVNEVKEFVENNGLKRPHVIAHSFGGRIVIKLASENTEFFDRIVLTGSAGLKPKRNFRYVLKKFTFNILKKFINRENLRRFYSSDYINLSPIMKESFKLIISENLDDRLSLIKNNTLIISGTNDKETPPYMAKRLNKGILNSELIMIKDAGHFCFIDSPEKFNTEVKEFLLS